MTQELETLLAEKFGARKGPLAKRFRRAGRRLPSGMQVRADEVLKALEQASHPKLIRMIDPDHLRRRYDELRAHLRSIDPADRRKGFALGVLGGLAFNILLLTALAVLFVRWRGLL
ncbi:hypothetical protein [Thalassovita taeanensis]|nr:hypothetical protein [Thalassovita taeanensis]